MLRAAAMEQERRREADVQAQAERDSRAELERAAAEAQRRADHEAEVHVDRVDSEAQLHADDQARARAEENIAPERRTGEDGEHYPTVPPLVENPAPATWYRGEAAYMAAMDYAAKVEPTFRPLRITRAHRHAGAAAAAAVIAILFALGWAAMSNRRPADPLGVNTLVQQPNVDQQTPFGSTTIKPVASNQPLPTRAQQVSARKAAEHQSGAVGHQQKPATTHMRRAQRRSDDDVADDVVVRHFNSGRPVPAKAQQKQQAGLKKISDLQ